MSTRKTMAMRIMEARHASYAMYPAGYMDETDLLLMSQHYGELAAQQEELMSVSYPYLALARELLIPHAEVLGYADVVERCLSAGVPIQNRPAGMSLAHAERIVAAVRAERARQRLVAEGG